MAIYFNTLRKYQSVFRGAYEKANIWDDYSDVSEAIAVLDEEITESLDAVKNLDERGKSACEAMLTINDLDQKALKDIKGMTLTAICELLQVLAVLDKAEFLLEKLKGTSRRRFE